MRQEWNGNVWKAIPTGKNRMIMLIILCNCTLTLESDVRQSLRTTNWYFNSNQQS